MKLTEKKIHYSQYPLIKQIVLTETGYWGIDEKNHLIFNDAVIAKLNNAIVLQYPFFNRFGTNEFLIIRGEREPRDVTKSPNAWIICEKGIIQNEFYVGDFVQKVHVQGEKIVIAYSECGIHACPLADKILVVFNRTGAILKDFGTELWDFGWEVQTVAYKSETEIYIQTNSAIDIIRLNLETGATKQYILPFEVYGGGGGITCWQDTLYVGFVAEADYDYAKSEPNKINICQYNINEQDEIVLIQQSTSPIPYFYPHPQSLPDGVFVTTNLFERVDAVRYYWIADFKQ